MQLSECLKNEKNPNEIQIINDDALNLNPDNKFDIITMVGSTRLESGMYEKLITKVFSLLKDNGSFYYQTLDKYENKEDFEKLCSDNDMIINNYLLDESYGFKAQYWKVSR
jgi:cyclopropane fatty-acyl-phospholipid synthase-like methyltransferase